MSGVSKMSPQEIEPAAAPNLDMPTSEGATCSLSMIDTTCKMTMPAEALVEPVIPGHELLNFPTLSFLITHPPSGRRILFDLGCRKDFWNLPPPVAHTIDKKVPGIKVDKNLVDILVEGDVEVSKLEAAIISHHHFDHIGDPNTFPASMELVVGPGFRAEFLPGYPTCEASPAFENSFAGRNVREITFSAQDLVAGYRSYDYFADGSMYILHTPGHTGSHLSALVRTTPDTFVFLGADICHFGGVFRPTPYVPMPPALSGEQIGRLDRHAAIYACGIFASCHPDPENARTTAYQKPCSHADSWYHDPALAHQTVEKLKALDADDRILVLIAHDPALMNSVPLFPHDTLNDWYELGLKERLRWGFLNELPVFGEPTKYLVDGTYISGQRVRSLDVRQC